MNVHVVAAEVAVPAQQAYEYLADGIRQGEWTLGCWNREQVGEDLFRGVSLVNDGELYVRLLRDPEQLLVDCEVGSDPDALVHRISLRALPRGEGCLVVLSAWRTDDQSDDAWQQTQDLHAAEIHLIKGRLEFGS